MESGRRIFIMGHEKGVALGVPPNIGRREGVTGVEKGARGDGDGRQGEKAREGARGSEEILTWEGGERGREGVGRGERGARGGREGDRESEEILSWDTTL